MISKMLRLYYNLKTGRVHEDTAFKWKRRLSIIYMLLGWNLGTYAIYHTLKDKYPVSDGTDETYAEMMKVNKINNATFYRFDGFKMLDSFELKFDTDDESVLKRLLREEKEKKNKNNC